MRVTDVFIVAYCIVVRNTIGLQIVGLQIVGLLYFAVKTTLYRYVEKRKIPHITIDASVSFDYLIFVGSKLIAYLI